MVTGGDRTAKIRVPKWIWGGEPKRMLDEAGLRSRPVRDAPGTWSVQTRENYTGVKPDLLSAVCIAEGAQGDRYDVLLSASSAEIPIRRPMWVDERLEALGQRLGSGGEISDVLSHAQAVIGLARGAEVVDVVQHVHSELRSIRLADDDSLPFDGSSILFVRRNPELLHRLKFASVFLRIEHDGQLREDVLPASIRRDSDEARFSSSFELYSGMHLLDAYFSPLAGALSPYVWLLVAPKTYGVLGVTLGSTAIAGFARFSSDPIQTLSPSSGITGVPRPEIEATSARSAFEWWANALNGLFSVLSDLSLYVDSNGFYRPDVHLHAILTIEQLFRRVHSMQFAHRDTNSRLVLLFTLLDTLERLTHFKLERLCSHRHASMVLRDVSSRIPEDAAAILLPRAVDAVESLLHARNGFFMAGGASATGIPMPQADGSVLSLDLDSAVAAYIKVLRNATHGHGTKKDGVVAQTNSLLTQHNGDLSSNLGWLGYLYLLEILTDPERLRYKLGPKKDRGQQRRKG